MRLRTWLECVLILAAASVAAAGEWSDRATAVVVEATQARHAAESLPVLTPWPHYEWLRLGALADGRAATDTAAVGALFASTADGWIEQCQTALAAGDRAEAQQCAGQANAAVIKCSDLLTEAGSLARISRNQSTQCWTLLQ